MIGYCPGLKKFAAWGLIAYAGLMAAPSYAQVRTEGILPEDVDELTRAFSDLNTLKPSPKDIDDIIKLLSRSENYLRIDAFRTDNDTVLIKVEVLKRIADIKITGAKAIDETDILNAIGLKAGSLFDGGRMAVAGESVRELYGKNGYFNTSIKFSYASTDTNSLHLSVNIDENQPCLINKVIFESTNKQLAKKLEQKLKRVRNHVFTEAEILDIEKRADDVLRDDRYLNVKIIQKEAVYNEPKTTATLYYTVTEPYRYDVIFSGNNYYSTSSLLSKLDLDNFDHSSLDPAADITQNIRDYYVATGFPHSKVSNEVTAYEDQYLRRVKVTIDEGPRTKIEKIEVTGRISRSPEHYAKFLKKNSSELIDDGYFAKRDLDEGTKNLIIQLNNEGFLRAKIQSSRVEFSKDKGNARIEVVLDEGPLTQLRRIAFIGNAHFAEQELLKVLKIRANAPLRLNDLEQSIAQLQKFYLERGHLEMRIENQDDEIVQYDDKGAVANITFRIYEGPEISVASILIEGNTFTKDDVILRQIELNVGEVLTPEKLDEAKSRLERLEIFTRVEVRTLEANTQIAKRTLVVSVTEDSPGDFHIGFGANNQRRLTLRGFTGISYNNLGGSARAISTRINVQNNIVDHKYTEYEAGVSYLEPFLFDTSFRGRVNLSREENVKEVIDEKQLLIERKDDLNFNIERELTSKIHFSWRVWGLETVKYFSARKIVNPTLESKQQIASIGPLIDIDFRDNSFSPTRGTFTRLEADYASDQFGSSKKIRFFRTQGTVSHLLRVFTPKVVWANSLSGGWERNLNTEKFSGVPLSYAFFLGGFSTIRGYSGTRDDRTPTNTELDNDANRKLIVPIEANYYLVKSEVRFPIYGILGGVVFYDAGRVEVKRDNALGLGFDGNEKRSYGAGIRINTPVGPFSLDYGRKLDRISGSKESPDQWHLYFGTF